jgi:hypothetical protein
MAESIKVRTCVDRLVYDGKTTISSEIAQLPVQRPHRLQVRDAEGKLSEATVEIKVVSPESSSADWQKQAIRLQAILSCGVGWPGLLTSNSASFWALNLWVIESLTGRLRSDAGYGLRFGSSGSEARYGPPKSANATWAQISPPKWRAALMVRGGWLTRQLCISRCPMLTSSRSGFRDWLSAHSSTRRTAGCGPACPVV